MNEANDMQAPINLPPDFRPPLDYPEYPFHGLLRSSAEKYPERTALVHGDRELTFRELEGLSTRSGRRASGRGTG